MSAFLLDLRRAGRDSIRRPLSNLGIVLALALGIGATTAIWSVVSGVLLRPLPYDEPERLVEVATHLPGFDHHWLSPRELFELGPTSAITEAAGWVRRGSNLAGGSEPVRIEVAFASAGLASTLGVAPALGHFYRTEQDRRGAAPVIVLAEGVWRRIFGADPEIVGRRVELDGVVTEVVGVMPAGFELATGGVEAWVPLRLDPAQPGRREIRFLSVVARLAPGVSREQATGELNTVVQPTPEERAAGSEAPVLGVRPLATALLGTTPKILGLLLAAVAVVLALTCANVALMLLARAETRRAETALRLALGADRRTLVRQLGAESLVLTLPATVLGVALAQLGLTALLAGHGAEIPRSAEIRIDLWVLLLTLAVGAASTTLFALVPVFHARRLSPARELGAGTLRGAGDLRRRRGARLLIAAEMGLAVALALAAGLLTRGLAQLLAVDPGLDPRPVTTFRLFLPPAYYPETDDATRFYEELTARLAALPGCEAAAAFSEMPFTRSPFANEIQLETAAGATEPTRRVEFFQYVTPEVFTTLGIRLLAGRGFEPGDQPGAPGVVVVNQAFERAYFPDRPALGRRLRLASWDASPWLTIVGVVADVNQAGLDRTVAPEIYLLHRQAPETVDAQPRTMIVAVRSPLATSSLAGGLRQTLHELDPRLPLAGVRSLEEALAGSLGNRRLATRLVALFSLLALGLAIGGVYGVLAGAVARRRHEMAVRLALGAERRDLILQVLREGMSPSVLGIVLGLAAGWAFKGVLGGLVFGISPGDPATFVAVPAALAVVAAGACLVPAWRSTRVEPVASLRSG